MTQILKRTTKYLRPMAHLESRTSALLRDAILVRMSMNHNLRCFLLGRLTYQTNSKSNDLNLMFSGAYGS